MLAQVLEILAPGIPYTSNGEPESVVFQTEKAGYENFGLNLNQYNDTLYKLQNADAIKKFREERNTLLDKSDKYMTTDYPHRLELDIHNWVEYRQSLRDLPRTARPTLDADGNLTGVEWPVVPTP
jgi:hypothetical protein